MRTSLFYFLISVFVYFFFVGGVEAAYMKFDKTTGSVAAGSTFTLEAIVDAGSDQVTSTDMWILYDPTLLEAQTVASGTFFPAVTNNISPGKIYVAGLITDPGTYKTGSGTVATITFKGLQNGTATLSFDCRTDVSNSSKIIKNAVDPTNIIICSQNTTAVITIGTGASAVAPTTAASVPTTVYTRQTYPTALPQTGIADDMPKMMTMGLVFVMVGFVLRALLLL